MTNVLPLRRERGPSAIPAIQYSDKLEWLQKIACDPALTPSDKVIAMALSVYVNTQDGRAWPSHERLAKEAHLNERTVTRAMKALVERGYLTVEKASGRGSCNVYTFVPVNAEPASALNVDAAPTEAAEKGDKSYREPDRKGDKTCRERVTNPAAKGDKNCTLNKINNKNKKTKGAGARESVPQGPVHIPGPSKPKAPPQERARFVATADLLYPALARVHEELRGKPPHVLPSNLSPSGEAGSSFLLDIFEELERREQAALPDGWEGDV
ncbi:helix-turn-helix domain-containing protein [Pannonibacter phragmitetus]|uniref:helix-turn-helix domain-containing protein n=1 Tax=Pannonibacter phragmitetus TaxID=121719 RepID=UPI000F015002|nr:helix-turn-helix domain-containing protein [Pannonibacter phragmitetus]